MNNTPPRSASGASPSRGRHLQPGKAGSAVALELLRWRYELAEFSPTVLALFDREVAKYPADQKQSAVMACLTIVQREQGFVSADSEKAVAAFLGMAPIAVHEITTFYNMYNQQPVGKYKLNVCTNLPCQLRDGNKALVYLEKKLGVTMGGTTADGMFTLQQSECLGACADAPVMLVNDLNMCSFMSHDKLDQLIDGLKSAEAK
jgi:NADH-quinone oxidoreductase subunit E